MVAFTGAPPHTREVQKDLLPATKELDAGHSHVTPFCLGLRLPEQHCHNPMCIKVEGVGKTAGIVAFFLMQQRMLVEVCNTA